MASGSQSLYKGSDEIYNQDCDVCLSTGKTSEAISYCNICCEYLCQFCDIAHRGSKASRDHTIMIGSNIPPVSTRKQPTLPVMFCDTHRRSLLDTYCSTHDEVTCPTCKMTNHATCNTSTVCKHSAKIDVEKEHKKVANRLKDLTKKYDNLTKDRHTDKSTVMSQIQKSLSDMQQFRKNIYDQLNKLENKMFSEIRQIEETLKREIDGHVTLADDILHQIGDLDKSLSECEKSRVNDVMFVGLKKASSRADEYGVIIDEIQKEIYPIKIRFQPNDVLSDLIQQSQSLGTVANNRPIDSGSNQTSILKMSVKKIRVENVTSDAVSGCTFMSDGHVVLSCGNVMFVGLKKASSRADEYGVIIDEIQKEIYPIKIRFQPNGVLSDLIQQSQSLGTVANNRPIDSGSNQTSILNMSVKKKWVENVTSDRVYGCTFMSDGLVVLACGTIGLKLFDENFLLKTQLPLFSLDVSTINDTDVIVTQGFLKQLQRVTILPGIMVKNTLKMDRNCYGVDVYGDEIYVTCHDRPGNGEVRVLNMNGVVQRRLGVENGKYIFKRPRYVKVNGSKIFVSDWDTHTVTGLNTQGHVIYRYSDRDLKEPKGMYVDGEDNLLVCGANSNNVHMIRDDGRKEKILLSEKDGIHYPQCISYRPSDGCLMVGLHQVAKTDQKLILFGTR